MELVLQHKEEEKEEILLLEDTVLGKNSNKVSFREKFHRKNHNLIFTPLRRPKARKSPPKARKPRERRTRR
jgi:hypothetical protein